MKKKIKYGKYKRRRGIKERGMYEDKIILDDFKGFTQVVRAKFSVIQMWGKKEWKGAIYQCVHNTLAARGVFF